MTLSASSGTRRQQAKAPCAELSTPSDLIMAARAVRRKWFRQNHVNVIREVCVLAEFIDKPQCGARSYEVDLAIDKAMDLLRLAKTATRGEG